MNARQAREDIKENIRNILFKFKSFVGLSGTKHKRSNS